MLTTVTPGQNTRQAVFFGLLLLPFILGLFVLGIFTGRATEVMLPLSLTAAVILILSVLITLGLNWRIGLYMIMFFIMWGRVTALGSAGTLTATKLVIGATLVFMLTAILNGQLQGWWKRLIDPLTFVGIVFVLSVALPLPFMDHPEIAYEQATRRGNVVVLLLLMLVAVYDREILHRCILVLVVSGTLVAIATCSEAITGVGLLERLGRADPEIGSGRNVLQEFRGQLRLVGPSGDPNFHAHAMSLPCVLAFGLLLYYREWWKKALLIGALSVIGYNIMGTGSRSGALATLIGITMVFFLTPVRHRFAKLAIALTAAIGGLLILAAMETNVAAARIANPQQAAAPIAYRQALWKMTWEVFEDNPIVGSGVNSFPLQYHFYRVPGSEDRILRPHNSFMQLLSEQGLPGVVSYLGFFVFANIAAFSAALGSADRRLKYEAMALASLTYGFFIVSGTSNILENELFYLVFGLCGATYYIYRQETTKPSVPPQDRLPTPALVQQINRLAAQQRAAYPPGT